MIVYVVIDETGSPTSPLGDARFIEEINGDDPKLAAPLTIETRELEAGGLN
jgi:hypothetical protein